MAVKWGPASHLEICIPDTGCVLAERMVIGGWQLAASAWVNDEILFQLEEISTVPHARKNSVMKISKRSSILHLAEVCIFASLAG